MKRLTFNLDIHASREKVWDVLWSDESYRYWTAVFSEGSSAKSDWNEGSEIQFLDGKGSGMYSRIEKKTPLVQMTFRHLGEIHNGVKKEVSGWEDARESYFLSDKNGGTELRVELDTTPEYEQMFRDIFPRALDRVKERAEK